MLTEERDEVKLRDYFEDEMDFEAAQNRKHEELKEIDIMADENIFGDLTGGGAENTDNLFDTDDDDENIFASLTEGTVDMSDIFGTNNSDEE